jgi:hypothetical protein
MSEPLTLAELLQEHFDGVLETIERGRWGRWHLDRGLAERGRLVLVHHEAEYSVSLDTRTDWVTVISGEDWASASDIGELIYAMRDLEYARWLGILPDVPQSRLAAAE